MGLKVYGVASELKGKFEEEANASISEGQSATISKETFFYCSTTFRDENMCFKLTLLCYAHEPRVDNISQTCSGEMFMPW